MPDLNSAFDAGQKAGKALRGIGFDSLSVDVSKPTRDLKTRGSIIHASKENIFEFPVFVADSNSGNMTSITAVNDLITQLCASYVQIAVSAQPVVDIDSFKEGKPFKAFKTDVSQYLEYCSNRYQRDACHAMYDRGDGIFVEFEMLSMVNKTEEQILCEYVNYQPLEEFNHYFMEDKDETGKQRKRSYDGYGDPRGYDETETELSPNESKRKQEQEKRAGEKHGWDKDDQSRKSAKENRDIEKHGWDKDDQSRKSAREDRDVEKHNIDKSVKAGKFIDTTKINKLNSMTPMMMTVAMNVEDKQGKLHRQMEYVIGVKTFCRIFESELLPEVVEYPIKNMDKITRKAKWRAGEIGLFEYLFKTKAKKQTAIDSRDPRRKWYRRLYELADSKYSVTAGKLKQMSGKRSGLQAMLVGDNHGLMPNATFVITMQDVYNVKNETGIDLMNPKIACKFCDDMFLMAMIIIDDDNDSMYLLTPDTHNDFDIQSLDSVQKQMSMLDPSKARAFNSLMNGK